MEIFKQYEGFNTDIIKPGAVFYLNLVDRTIKDLEFQSRESQIVGNVYVVRADPTQFTFRTLRDIRDSTETSLRYVDVKQRYVEIIEMRELK